MQPNLYLAQTRVGKMLQGFLTLSLLLALAIVEIKAWSSTKRIHAAWKFEEDHLTPGVEQRAYLMIYEPGFDKLKQVDFEQQYKITVTRPIWFSPDLKLRTSSKTVETVEKDILWDREGGIEPGSCRLTRVGLRNLNRLHDNDIARYFKGLFSSKGIPTAIYRINFVLPKSWGVLSGLKARLNLRERGHRFGGYFKSPVSQSEKIVIASYDPEASDDSDDSGSFEVEEKLIVDSEDDDSVENKSTVAEYQRKIGGISNVYMRSRPSHHNSMRGITHEKIQRWKSILHTRHNDYNNRKLAPRY